MSRTGQIVEDMQARGVALEAEGRALRCSGPRRIVQEHALILETAKPGLLVYVRARRDEDRPRIATDGFGILYQRIGAMGIDRWCRLPDDAVPGVRADRVWSDCGAAQRAADDAARAFIAGGDVEPFADALLELEATWRRFLEAET